VSPRTGATTGRPRLVTIDVGTSGARATLFDLDGHAIATARRSYPTTSPQPGWSEQDARAWRRAALGALADLVDRSGRAAKVMAIGLTGQCPSVVLVDGAGRPTGPGLIYRDNRATAEAAAIRARFGDVSMHERTGHLPSAFHIAPKLLWWRAHLPASFSAGRLALQPRDLVALELTGEAATDGTHAAATLGYNLRAGRWDTELVTALDLDPDLFPPLVDSSAVMGRLRPHVARRVGLAPGIPIVAGGADSQACAFGAGVVGPGPISEMAGSSTCLNAAVPAPLASLEVTHYPHVIRGMFTTETGINTTGAAVGWLADRLYGRRRSGARTVDYAQLDTDAAAAPPGADGVLVLPTLADGERTDPELRAAITGLSLRHDRGTIARAVLEGVAHMIRSQLDLLRAAGTPVEELRVSGGDARIGSWGRIKADLLGVPVRTIPDDATATGVAMLAGIGAGIYRDPADAISRCVRANEPIEPDVSLGDRYAETHAAWLALAAASVVRREAG
jgi:xylulokinase